MATAQKFIDRNFSLSEHDDFQVNILPLVNDGNEPVELLDEDQNLIGWVLKRL
jgi:hypothetical protein